MNNRGFIVNLLFGLGLLCFIWFLYLMFFCNIKGDNHILFLITCVGALLFPICVIYKNGIETVEIKKSIIIAVCSLLVNIILIFFTSHKGTDFIDKLFLTLTSEPYRWLYLIMLVIACICVVAKNRIGVWLTAILLGIIAPAIIAAVLYVILFVIAIIFVLLFGSKGSSSSLSSSSKNLSSSTSNNTSPQKSNEPAQTKGIDNRRYASLIIEYARDEDAARNAIGFYKAIETLPLDFTYDQISRYLQKKYMLSYNPVIVKTSVNHYANKDSVDPMAYNI